MAPASSGTVPVVPSFSLILHTRWRSSRGGATAMKILTIAVEHADSTAERMDRFLSLVGERSRERFASRGRSVTVLQSLIAEVAARGLLARSVGCTFNETTLEHDATGKPRFSFNGTALSIAHSGDMVAVAIADQPVGIDVQRVRRVRAGLAERFFHPAELLGLRAADLAARDELLIGMWARKESFAKFCTVHVHYGQQRTEAFILATCATSGTAHQTREA